MGPGPVAFEPTPLSVWDGIAERFDAPEATRVDLDKLDSAEVATWKTGQTLLLSGRVLTARDAAHKRLVDLLDKGQPLPVDLRGRVIYYVGPVDAVQAKRSDPPGQRRQHAWTSSSSNCSGRPDCWP